jgi:hypothetical protein
MEALFERTLEVKSHLLPVDNRSKRERQSYWQKRVIEAFSGRSLGIIDTLSQPSALDIKNSTGALIRLQELCSKLQVSRIDNGQFLFS